METENSQKLFSVSITHNSKIRELSNGNRVIVCQTTFLLWVPSFLNYELWKQRIELSKKAIQTAPQSLAQGAALGLGLLGQCLGPPTRERPQIWGEFFFFFFFLGDIKKF